MATDCSFVGLLECRVASLGSLDPTPVDEVEDYIKGWGCHDEMQRSKIGRVFKPTPSAEPVNAMITRGSPVSNGENQIWA